MYIVHDAFFTSFFNIIIMTTLSTGQPMSIVTAATAAQAKTQHENSITPFLHLFFSLATHPMQDKKKKVINYQ